ncbi:MAG: response regulator [Anaerolineae bacterium]|nr:response regulator [Anaerolineae bacterium]
MDVIRVLLVEDNPGDARLIREMLSEVREVTFDVQRADRLSASLERLAEGGIDVVLLDLSLPDSQGLETFARVYAQAPEVPVVLLTGLDDADLAVRAVREGAQDYLVKGQLDSGLLARAIRYAIERHRAQVERLLRARRVRAGKVLGFMGAKGGVGTTTVALNVAMALAQQKKSVIAVELRSCWGTFAPQLGHTPAENLRSLLDLDPRRINEKELNTRLVNWASGLHVLFGPQKVEEFMAISDDQAEAIIKALAGMADVTIVDLPGYPCEASRAAIQLCDRLALVVEPEAVSVASGRLTLELLEAWGVGGGVVGLVVVNRAMLAMPLTTIQSQLGCEIIGVVPPAMEACIAAQKRGVPLLLHQPEHLAAVSLTEIANKLVAD